MHICKNSMNRVQELNNTLAYSFQGVDNLVSSSSSVHVFEGVLQISECIIRDWYKLIVIYFIRCGTTSGTIIFFPNFVICCVGSTMSNIYTFGDYAILNTNCTVCIKFNNHVGSFYWIFQLSVNVFVNFQHLDTNLIIVIDS